MNEGNEPAITSHHTVTKSYPQDFYSPSEPEHISLSTWQHLHLGRHGHLSLDIEVGSRWLSGVTYSLASNNQITGSCIHSKPTSNHRGKTVTVYETDLTLPLWPCFPQPRLRVARAWHDDISQISMWTNIMAPEQSNIGFDIAGAQPPLKWILNSLTVLLEYFHCGTRHNFLISCII